VNLYNTKVQGIFYSIYSFSTVYGYKEIDYESARIDKIYLDLDIQDYESNYDYLYEATKRVHQFWYDLDVTHSIIFSGGGFNFYIYINDKIFIKHRKDCLKRVHKWIIKKTQIRLDRTVIGDVAQIARVPGTYNKGRGRWCVSLTREEFLSGMDKIFEIASEQRLGVTVIGNRLLNIKKFDIPYKHIEFDFLESNKKRVVTDKTEVFSYLSDLGIYIEEIPDCIENMLKTPDLDYQERYCLIQWCMDNMLELVETCRVLKFVLNDVYFAHCVTLKGAPWRIRKQAGRCERQPQYIYNKREKGKEYYLYCGTIQELGWCVGELKCRTKGKVIP